MNHQAITISLWLLLIISFIRAIIMLDFVGIAILVTVGVLLICQ